MASSKTTIDHDEIRRWAEERGGRPAHVKDTGSNGDLGILRIDFQDPDDNLEQIDWDAWFEAFDENNLALVYQDEKQDGETSTFNKLVARENA